jgi:glutamine amidotransferase
VTNTVVVADYGVGNLLSVRSAIEQCGGRCELSNDPDVIERADRLLLPGVGAFGEAMDDMRAAGLVEPMRRFAASGKPLLGICLGMQMLMDESEEFGHHAGLGLIPGQVRALPQADTTGRALRVPRVGWGELNASDARRWDGSILARVPVGAWMYFVHSFTAVPRDASDVMATSAYGGHELAAVVARDNVTGCQFHPEKSGAAGLAVIARFLELSDHRATT